jgi:hypothetical protein
METIFWIGPYKDFNVGLRQIPGLLYNNCNEQPCSQYSYKLFDKTVIFNYLLMSNIWMNHIHYTHVSQK